MKAVLLCAGFGTRLGDLTRETPKPLLPVGGIPMLVHTIRHIRQFGFDDIAINLHYFPEKITEVIGDGRHFGVSVRYSHEETPLGTAGALIPLKDWLENEEAFLVYYGDILTNQDISALVEKQVKTESYATLLLHYREKSNSVVLRNEEGRITLFLERPDEEACRRLGMDRSKGGWVNSGIQLISRKALFDIIENGLFDLPRDLYARKYPKECLQSVCLTGYRVAVDSPQRYEQACRQWPDRKYQLC